MRNILLRYRGRLLLVLAFALGAFTLSARSQEIAPDVLVDRVTTEVLDAVREDKILQAGDRARSIALAEAKIVPHIDFVEATRLAVGRSWRNATPAQREALAREFRTLLVRTYASALESYRDQTLKKEPVRFSADRNEARVRHVFQRSATPPVAIDYRMRRSDNGWKVYDIVVDGMSLVLNYRDSFSEETARGGIDGLIARLIQKNAQPT